MRKLKNEKVALLSLLRLINGATANVAILVFRRRKQEDGEFRVTLSYLARLIPLVCFFSKSVEINF